MNRLVEFLSGLLVVLVDACCVLYDIGRPCAGISKLQDRKANPDEESGDAEKDQEPSSSLIALPGIRSLLAIM